MTTIVTLQSVTENSRWFTYGGLMLMVISFLDRLFLIFFPVWGTFLQFLHAYSSKWIAIFILFHIFISCCVSSIILSSINFILSASNLFLRTWHAECFTNTFSASNLFLGMPNLSLTPMLYSLHVQFVGGLLKASWVFIM